MSKQETLARIEADLTQGHTHLALQRLVGLTRTYPIDLDIRARRAVVCRQVGDLIEAGRWGYLAEELIPAETAAFERAFSTAGAQLRALRWRGQPEEASSTLAQQRLRDLAERVRQEGGQVTWIPVGSRRAEPEKESSLGCQIILLVPLLLLVLVIIGAVTVISWLVDLV